MDGDTDIVYDFDPDYLCYQDLQFRYQNSYGFKMIEKIFMLEQGKELKDSLFLVHDDTTVKKILNYISRYSCVREINFYADHNVDTPLYMPQILEITWETMSRGETNREDINETGGGHFNETEGEVQVNTEPNST